MLTRYFYQSDIDSTDKKLIRINCDLVADVGNFFLAPLTRFTFRVSAAILGYWALLYASLALAQRRLRRH